MMKVLKHLEHMELKEGSAVALGTFDGLHIGHQAVINHTVRMAAEKNLQSVVFTFSNLPRHFNKGLYQEERILCIDDKIELFEQLGVDVLVIVPFNSKVQGMSREAFLEYLLKSLNMKSLTVGYNFRFGLKAEGTAQWLLEQQEAFDFECKVVSAVVDQSDVVSSTRIREALRNGDILLANELLGRHHYVSGVVHPGKQLGRTIGYPTANLKISPNMTLIKSGVYVTETIVDGRMYQSVTNVGFNPTFEQEDFNLETFIFDFDEVLYHKSIKVVFRNRIRDELKFGSVEELKDWIAKDVQEAMRFFER